MFLLLYTFVFVLVSLLVFVSRFGLVLLVCAVERDVWIKFGPLNRELLVLRPLQVGVWTFFGEV